MNTQRTVTKLVLLGLLALGLVRCGGESQTSADGKAAEPAATAVTVKGFLFKPSPLEVKAGSEVVWTNQDQILHTVAAGTPPQKSGAFGGEMPERGAVYRFTFKDPGTYPYFCERHNSMTGTVIVT